ncbi:MAG: hypothetical protein HETSPECPRED_009065 [Heterodermia speciosa]|uniref:Probable glucan endo-1,3-beta-glucosidase eglC n=1 Tax=Heterodermia speciosa TaxID=116794 RepID=A0A8H3G366_9LECA|nr:MAG: hypothetical protein HETSPECPRED_009065 [Heterodermia speciosa]
MSCLAASAQAYWKGFNLPATLPSGACKSVNDWKKDFAVVKGLPGKFNAVRLYAASDCNTLANAVPAAKASGVKVLVGVWTEDDGHFNAEKQALLAAVKKYGHDWIVSVSVGSEDLYRKDTSAEVLANKINDVRGMLWSVGAGKVQVGHVDTWTAWVDPKNKAAIKACDFVGTDGYPYFQDAARKDSYNVFWQSIEATRSVVNSVKPGTWVWITETGWPVRGPTRGKAIPSVAGAAAYWKSVACSAFSQAHTFWYILQDYHESPSFGVVDQNFKPLYDLKC